MRHWQSRILLVLVVCVGFFARADIIRLTRPNSANPADIAFAKGVDLLTKGDLTAAEAAFLDSQKLAPNRGVPYVGLADVALKRKQFDKAQGYLQQAIAKEPASGGIQEAWGRFLFEMGKYKEAEAPLRKATAADPKDAGARIALADAILKGSGNATEAIAVYREGIKLQPDHAGGHFGLGSALARQGSAVEARAEFEQAARLAPKNPMPRQALGELYMVEKDWAKAQREFEAALLADPEYMPSRMALGDVLVQRGNITAGINEYTTVATKMPKSPVILMRLAQSLQRINRPVEAQRLYLAVIQLEPNSAVAYNNLAYMCAESKKDLAQGIRWAQKANSLAPGNPDFLDTLGWVQFASGQKAQAYTSLQQSVAKSPNAGSLYHFGVVAESLGKIPEAKASLTRALQMDPKFPEANDARQRLGRYPR